MNNLFKVFTIEVPGQNLDDKRFFEYSDFDSNVMTTPTDAQVLQKAIAYTRMQQIKRKLSELTVPLYCSVEFDTDGTSSTIPTGATITVGYLSYEPFVSTLAEIPKTDAEQITAAEGVIKEIIDNTLADGLQQELAAVQSIVSVPDNALVSTAQDQRDVFMEYIDVPELDSVVSTVSFVKL